LQLKKCKYFRKNTINFPKINTSFRGEISLCKFLRIELAEVEGL